MEPTKSEFQILPATEKDIPRVYELIVELAIYEKLRHMVIGSVEDLVKFSFGSEKVVHVHCGWLNGIIIGYSLHFLNFSTFLCKPGIYLEDIYIQPEYRAKGYGKKMLLHLCHIAKQNNYGRVEWQVLNWNEPSIKFYESLGAQPLKEWTQYRLVGETLTKAADKFLEL